MKRLISLLSTIAAFALPNLASAQTLEPSMNNPTWSGLYFEGTLGVNFASEIDFDFDNAVFDDFSADPNTGYLFGLALGYNIPQGDINIRVEGEFSGRENGVDELDFATTSDQDVENAEIQSLAGMLNAYVDYYFIPNLAVTVGAGIGYANVTPDVVVISDDEDTSGFAYQGRLGARYNMTLNSAISLGYTYFKTVELEIDSAAGNEINFDYANHGFHLGAAYFF